MGPDERIAYLALALTPGIGARRLASLLARYGSALGALSAPFEFLCTVPGISPAAATAISQRTPAMGQAVLDALDRLGAAALVPGDDDFPAAVREIPDPPTLLFVLGDLALLRRAAVAIVGSRDHSAYGAAVCRQLSGAAAAAGLAVVSGMARGLDAVAHAAAIEAGGATIGVLGNGFGVIYPAANRALYGSVAERGLLVSEFPPGERPHAGSFPRRNRLISGLARVTVVVEAVVNSGTLITVESALAQGKEVMAVPGNITSPTSVGTNGLLRDGAAPVLGIEDILGHYPEAGGPPRALRAATKEAIIPPVAPPDLAPLERRLFERLGGGPASVDALVSAAGVEVGEALAALSMLELRGLVALEGGHAGLVLSRASEPGGDNSRHCSEAPSC
jgi:DNA processing protein